MANVGFVIAELLSGGKINNAYISVRKRGFLSAVFIAILTCTAAFLFALHYLSVVASGDFFHAIKARFFARNISTNTSWRSLIYGYYSSFQYEWFLLFILIVLASFLYSGFSWVKVGQIWHNRILVFLLCFPLVENIIMKQHAVAYTYDRMKMIFPLVFLICDLIFVISLKVRKRQIYFTLLMVVSLICGANWYSYAINTSYIWDAPYKADNMLLASYLNETFTGSVIGVENISVRGYINLLFNRGIYEWKGADELKTIAEQKGKRYAIEFETESIEPWNMTDFKGAIIYDLQSGKMLELLVQSGELFILDQEGIE